MAINIRAKLATDPPDQPAANQPQLSWFCAFCPKMRIYGGAPRDPEEWCHTCDSRVATCTKDQTAIRKIVGEHLI